MDAESRLWSTRSSGFVFSITSRPSIARAASRVAKNSDKLVAVGEEAVVFLQLLVGVGGGAPLKLADDAGFVTEVQGFVAGINMRLVALGPGEVVVVEL